MRRWFYALAVAATALLGAGGYYHPPVLWGFVVVGPLVLLGLYDTLQRDHTVLRNFPVIGHLRYLFESISPEIQQYFIERHTDGTPFSRTQRSLVYARSKDERETHPFGTELDLYDGRYEGLAHSIYPSAVHPDPPRVRVGGPACSQPYDASLLNISAMSYGALSRNAIQALNEGARLGGFYHNTGEGGVSPYHLAGGGDLVWQIGTGYFGCRTAEGRFDDDAFAEKAAADAVRMVEIKLSQGAKPGHGGVLPGVKNTTEIARIRGVEAGTTVLSPPGHREFSDAAGLLRFVQRLRRLASGKPVGIKLCLGRPDEFIELCHEMRTCGVRPDFVTVDGAEGGTGAAPLEFSDSVGSPLEPALAFVDRVLREHELRADIRVIASGKLLTGHAILKALALGADLCNCARGFMFSLGCIQALRCDTNRCPAGVATQDPMLTAGLVVADKATRVRNFHRSTVHTVMELLAATGKERVEDLTPDLFLKGADIAGFRDQHLEHYHREPSS